MTDAVLGVLIGAVAGVLSGLFGVGGGIVMTPGIQILVGTSPIVALATPLPVILPTALTGAITYSRAKQVDMRAAGWMIASGLGGAAAGAALTEVIDTHLLLVATAALLGWQSVGILRKRSRPQAQDRPTAPMAFVAVGLAAGLVSGLLGVGGGLVMVPLLTEWLGMPLKRALGTSLAAIVALVIPGTIVHAALGNIDWGICLAVVAGAVPGARAGARLALGTRERALRVLVGSFLVLVAVGYGISELGALTRR
jgi:uncharacterized membrane protein YfcA